jgi:hypothetical protein
MDRRKWNERSNGLSQSTARKGSFFFQSLSAFAGPLLERRGSAQIAHDFSGSRRQKGDVITTEEQVL